MMMGNGFLPQIAGGVSPAIIPNCQLWLDANDPGTLWADINATTPATSTIQRWNDKSGNERHATEATTPPVIGNIGGKTAVSYTSGAQRLLVNIPLNLAHGTIFLVGKRSNDTSRCAFLNDSGSSAWMKFSINSWEATADYVSNFIIGNTTATATLNGEIGFNASNILDAVIISGIWSATDNNLKTYRNGVLISNVTGTAPGWVVSQLNIGGSNYNQLRGSIGEIAIYNRRLSAVEHNQLIDYLVRKWT